jgi:hypothetical protein
MLGEAAVGLCCERSKAFVLAGCLKRVKTAQVQVWQVHAGETPRLGHLPEEVDSSLPVPRRLDIAKHPLRRLGRMHPGRQLLSGSTSGSPVPDRLGGRRVIPSRLQRPRHAFVERRPLAGQQAGCHRLDQQGMPRPQRAAGNAVGEQPRAC